VRKYIVLALTVLMVLGLMGGVVMAEDEVNNDDDFDVDYMAAPAVAGMLLEAAGVDNRYGTGRDGGNFIRDVAHHMDGTDFSGVCKTDVIAYECAVAEFLNDPENGEHYPANVVCPCAGIIDPEASGAEFVDNEDGTGTLTITLVDLCGDPMEYAQRYFRAETQHTPTNRFYFIGGSILTYATRAQHQGDGVYTFTLTKPCGWNDVWNVGIAHGTTTDDRVVIEEDLVINIEYTPFMEGDWEVDFYLSGSTWEHVMFVIDHEDDGSLTGNGGYTRDADPDFSHEWDITSGQVTCFTDKSSEPWTDVIEVEITILYTTANAGYSITFNGQVDFEGGTMSGDVSGDSTGTFSATKR